MSDADLHYGFQEVTKFLAKWNAFELGNKWGSLHNDHFDWWMFPIDDGSMPEFNVTSEEHVAQLKSEREWLLGYREGVRLALAAWGWDTSHEKRIVPIQQGMGWTHWDIRLSKIIRSLFLFEETQLLNSVQAFARELQKNEKKAKTYIGWSPKVTVSDGLAKSIAYFKQEVADSSNGHGVQIRKAGPYSQKLADYQKNSL
eukprot:gene2553-9319_t